MPKSKKIKLTFLRVHHFQDCGVLTPVQVGDTVDYPPKGFELDETWKKHARWLVINKIAELAEGVKLKDIDMVEGQTIVEPGATIEIGKKLATPVLEEKAEPAKVKTESPKEATDEGGKDKK